MAFTMTIMITLFIGTIVILICGRENILKIIFPLLILLISDFLFLYAKFVTGDPVITWLIFIPAIALLIIAVIWFIILLIIGIRRKHPKKNTNAIKLSLAVTAIILFIPALTPEDKYKLYRNDYLEVSDAIFQAYDEGELSVGDQLHSPPHSTLDLEKIETLYSKDIVKKMKRLNRNAGVYTYIVADEDVIYFSFGAFFQSISGIAITRNGKELSNDGGSKAMVFDGVMRYEYIEEGVYRFYDGL